MTQTTDDFWWSVSIVWCIWAHLSGSILVEKCLWFGIWKLSLAVCIRMWNRRLSTIHVERGSKSPATNSTKAFEMQTWCWSVALYFLALTAPLSWIVSCVDCFLEGMHGFVMTCWWTQRCFCYKESDAFLTATALDPQRWCDSGEFDRLRSSLVEKIRKANPQLAFLIWNLQPAHNACTLDEDTSSESLSVCGQKKGV